MAWELLGSTKLTVAAATLTVTGFEVRQNLIAQIHLIAQNSIGTRLRVNADSSALYSYRGSSNGASDFTGASQTELANMDTSYTGETEFHVIYIENVQDEEKLFICSGVGSNASGVGVAPKRRELAGKYADNTNSITEIDVVDYYVGSNFAAGSEMTVFGSGE
tara:strand:+ start:619 stop:1107 length:489 start_codon:yes stop_codon:yes gene_type:complete